MRKITAYEFVEILSSAEFSDTLMQRVAEDDLNYKNLSKRETETEFCDMIYDGERSQKVYEAVRDIQYFADGYFDARSFNSIVEAYEKPVYYYWTDGNERTECRTELEINYNTMVLKRNVFDEHGDRVSSEVLYSYPYELEKAALKKYGCSEERKANRMESPYKKVEFKELVSPKGDEKLVGEEVLVPENAAGTEFMSRNNYLNELMQLTSGDDFGHVELPYMKAMANGKAYPNMRKITPEEVVELFEKAEISADFDYNNMDECLRFTNEVISEIKKIQYFPDVTFGEYGDSGYLYWPDADTVTERRHEIEIFSEEGLVRLVEYDDKGNMIKNEDIFDVEKKVKDMASGSGTE